MRDNDQVYQRFKQGIRHFRPETQECLLEMYEREEHHWKTNDEDFHAWALDTNRLKDSLARLRKRVGKIEKRVDNLEKSA